MLIRRRILDLERVVLHQILGRNSSVFSGENQALRLRALQWRQIFPRATIFTPKLVMTI